MTRRRWAIAVAAVAVLALAGCGGWWLATDHHGERVSGPYGGYPGTAGTRAELGRFTGPVRLVDGLAVVGAGNRIRTGGKAETLRAGLAAVDLRTGSAFWTYRRDGHDVQAFTVSRGAAYVLWEDGLLVRLDLRTARSVWHRQLDHVTNVHLLGTAGGGLLVVAEQALVAVDPADGTVRWQVRPGQECVFNARAAAPALRVVVVGSGSTSSAGACPGRIRAYRLDSGRVAWQHGSDRLDAVAGPLVATDDTTVVGTDTVWDADSGRTVRTLRDVTDGSGTGGGLLFRADGNGLTATDPRTGRRVWRQPVPAGRTFTGTPAYLDGGHVCVVVRTTGGDTATLRLTCYAPRTGEAAGGTDVPVVAPDVDPASQRQFRRRPDAYVSDATPRTVAVTETDPYLMGLGAEPPVVVLPRQP
ncbi:outer membrane protein assembly factor BamB family protein [Actinocatenispora rupis]|nr:PQQ-binding-like beta-propeller repeat protein [Actinocatenispora rupis]